MNKIKKKKCSHVDLFILFISIILDWRKVVESDWFLIIRWVVQSPFRIWDLFRDVVWFRESIAACVGSVVGNRLQCILLHDFICHRDEIVIYSACWFGWVFICPVDVFVIGSSDGIHPSPVPVWVTR